MTRTRFAATAVFAATLVVTSLAQQSWYGSYDEAIKHVQAGEWQQAETKLLQAKKDGPSSGRNVLRYGSLRAPYFPDYYLGIVYQSTGRPQEALESFEAARKANIDVKNSEFKLIGTFEGAARTALANAKSVPPAPKGPVAPAGPDPAAVKAAAQKDFDGLMASARAQLGQRNFDASEQSATSARNLAIKQGLGTEQRAETFLREISGTRLAATVEDALNRKDAAAARRALNVLVQVAPTFSADALEARVARLEKDSAPSIPVTPTPTNTNTGTNAAASVGQFEGLISAARTQLGQRNFDVAEQSANNASRLAIKQGLGQNYEQRADKLLGEIDGSRRAARVEAAVARKDAVAARKELNTLKAVLPEYDVASLERSVGGMENLIRATLFESTALKAFYQGRYQEALQNLGEIDRLDARNARTLFYRACSLASLAAASADPTKDPRLTDAKKTVAEAMKQPDRFKEDLRYISPKVRQLLGI